MGTNIVAVICMKKGLGMTRACFLRSTLGLSHESSSSAYDGAWYRVPEEEEIDGIVYESVANPPGGCLCSCYRWRRKRRM